MEIDHWEMTPHLSGRLATEQDVIEDRAVFHLSDPEKIGASPYDLKLPACAILRDEEDEENDQEIPVIIIQAEQVEHWVFVGFRFLTGDSGVAFITDVEILNGPDERFFKRQQPT
jgi:hypothetical protein